MLRGAYPGTRRAPEKRFSAYGGLAGFTGCEETGCEACRLS
jgi:hypothetical protein